MKRLSRFLVHASLPFGVELVLFNRHYAVSDQGLSGLNDQWSVTHPCSSAHH